MVRIVCASDTHNQLPETLPEGDVLIHAGDLTNRGTEAEVGHELEKLGAYPHPLKILVPGNHDFLFQEQPEVGRMMAAAAGVELLIDEELTSQGLIFFGSPWTPVFGSWAFMLDEDEIAEKWSRIPHDVDVLITHGPPFGIGDMTPRGQKVGCKDLEHQFLDKAIEPKLHVFGHIHHAHGVYPQGYNGPTLFVNASLCDERYRPVNPPVVINL